MPSKKVNPNYRRKFIILSVIKEEKLFNEMYFLFDKETSIYGSVAIDNDTHLLSLDKNNF